jgi:hypothetical protein
MLLTDNTADVSTPLVTLLLCTITIRKSDAFALVSALQLGATASGILAPAGLCTLPIVDTKPLLGGDGNPVRDR